MVKWWVIIPIFNDPSIPFWNPPRNSHHYIDEDAIFVYNATTKNHHYNVLSYYMRFIIIGYSMKFSHFDPFWFYMMTSFRKSPLDDPKKPIDFHETSAKPGRMPRRGWHEVHSRRAACSAGAACARFDARISTRGAVVFRHGLGEKKRKKMGKTWGTLEEKPGENLGGLESLTWWNCWHDLPSGYD